MARNRTIIVEGNTTKEIEIEGNYITALVRQLSWSGVKPTVGTVLIEYQDADGDWWPINGGNIDLSDNFAMFPTTSGRVLNALRVTVSGVSPPQTLTVDVYLTDEPMSELSRFVSQATYPVGRLQVDAGNTGFFDGREFRYFREFNIPSGQSVWTRVTVNGNGIILREQNLSVDQGAVRFRAWRNVALTGVTFTAPASPLSGIFQNNNLPSAPVQPLVTVIENGGNHSALTGGTVSEIKRVRSSGATAQTESVGSAFQGERGIAPGVYYLQLEALGNNAALGVYDLIFEQRLGQG